MSIPDNYEINVALDGKHYCRIELPDNMEHFAVEKLNKLRTIFGKDFELTMTHWTCRGQEIKGD